MRDLVELIAPICHEASSALAKGLGQPGQRPWDLLPANQRQYILDFVSRQLETDEPVNRQLHEEWLEQQSLEGWSHGDEYSDEEKTDPRMVPYDELSAEVRLHHLVMEAIVASFRTSNQETADAGSRD